MIHPPGTLRLAALLHADLVNGDAAQCPGVRAVPAGTLQDSSLGEIPSPCFGEIPLHPPFVEPGVYINFVAISEVRIRIRVHNKLVIWPLRRCHAQSTYRAAMARGHR
jgi:hypothetical protein